MTYLNAWNESQPLGSAGAQTIDDIIRQLKVDIRERMNSVVVSWAADPVVLAGQSGRTITLGPAAILSVSPSTIGDAVSLVINPGYIPLPVSSDYRITKAEVLVDKYLSTSLDCSLVETLFNTSQFGAGTYGPISHSTNGIQIVTIYSSSGGFPVTNQSAWTIKITSSSSSYWRFYGARITYNA